MLANDVEGVHWSTGGQNVRTSRRKASTPGETKRILKKIERDKGPIIRSLLQLFVDKLIIKNCKRRKTTLGIVWIDYKKVFDMVPPYGYLNV